MVGFFVFLIIYTLPIILTLANMRRKMYALNVIAAQLFNN